jgi:hypothetical protein
MASVSVEVSLDEFDTDELIRHLQDCGYIVLDEDARYLNSDELEGLYEAYRFDRPAFEKMMCEVFYQKLGRIA